MIILFRLVCSINMRYASLGCTPCVLLPCFWTKIVSCLSELHLFALTILEISQLSLQHPVAFPALCFVPNLLKIR